MLVFTLFILNFTLIWAHTRSPGVFQLTPPIDHAEGPVWDGRKGLLFYVDIHSGHVLSYEYCSGKTHSISLYGEVSVVIPAKTENLLYLSLNRSLVALQWDGRTTVGKQKILVTVSPQYPSSRFNDGKADKRGRIWLGTMGHENASGVVPDEGILYKFTKTNYQNPLPVIAPVNISNGLAWNKKNDKFFYIDTPTRKVVSYDYDDLKGEITNKKVVFDVNNQMHITGGPDGMTIDEDDNLWVALYNGGAVIKIDPRTGKLLQKSSRVRSGDRVGHFINLPLRNYLPFGKYYFEVRPEIALVININRIPHVYSILWNHIAFTVNGGHGSEYKFAKVKVIGIPAQAVTSVAWGGPKLDILFVTTSRFALNAEQRKQQPAAGAIFAITDLGTRGLPSFEADIVDII